MIWIGLLLGFAAGMACVCGLRALRRARGMRWMQWTRWMKPEQPDEAKLPENRELARLRRQRAAIDRYTGSSADDPL